MLYNGTCHCKAVRFKIETDLKNIKQCNCSVCKRKYAKMNLINKEQFNLIDGEENLSVYEFGTMKAKHFFCKKCGIYTHHYRKSDPNGMGVNIGCIDDLDPFTTDSELLDNK